MLLERDLHKALPGYLCSVGDGSADVLRRQLGILFEQFLLADPRREVVEDEGNPNPGSSNAGFAEAHVGIQDPHASSTGQKSATVLPPVGEE